MQLLQIVSFFELMYSCSMAATYATPIVNLDWELYHHNHVVTIRGSSPAGQIRSNGAVKHRGYYDLPVLGYVFAADILKSSFCAHNNAVLRFVYKLSGTIKKRCQDRTNEGREMEGTSSWARLNTRDICSLPEKNLSK